MEGPLWSKAPGQAEMGQVQSYPLQRESMTFSVGTEARVRHLLGHLEEIQ